MRPLLATTTALLLTASAARADYTGGEVHGGGSIFGKVTFAGPRPKLAARPRDRSPDICGAEGADESLVVSEGLGIKNAVVYLKDIKSGKPLKPGTADLDQRGCTYVPHLLAVPVGTTLNLLNSDPLLHNVHGVVEQSTVFNYAMPGSLKKIPKKLTKPGFVLMKCDVHAWMSGVLAVMENPYFAVTGDDGSFTLTDVPPGTYTLAVWHETLASQGPQAPKTAPVTVAAGAATQASFTLSK